MKALLTALVLSALPFPTPKLISVTDRTKCDWGPVNSVKPDGSEFVLTTPAGAVTYKAGLEVQVIGADGKAAGSVSALKPGQSARVYYEVGPTGAKAQEVDLF